MDEVQNSVMRPQTVRRKRSRRSQRLNWTVAIFSWSLAAVVLAFSLHYWITAHILRPVDLLNVATGVIGATIGGILALRGDGDVILFTGADERQRAVIGRASGWAFGVGFWGLFLLWMSYQLIPAWRADAYLHIGILLLVTTLTYLLGYLWQRSRI